MDASSLLLYLQGKGMSLVVKGQSDRDLVLVALLCDPDAGRDHAQSRVILGTMDDTDLALDLSCCDNG